MDFSFGFIEEITACLYPFATMLFLDLFMYLYILFLPCKIRRYALIRKNALTATMLYL